MALQQDERALLQLVCERGQSYHDLAGLLGIGEDEVRAKARSALTELGGADPDAEVGLTDYLLGQADPIGRADAVRYLQQDAEARELAETIVAKLQAIAPGATLPTLPEPKGRRRKAAPAEAGDAATIAERPREERPAATAAGDGTVRSRQSALIAGLAAGGLILVVVILLVTGVFSGDDGDGEAASPEEVAAESQREITPVQLEPVDGSGVAGRADFGLANTTLFMDLTVDGLDPKPPEGTAYVAWMMVNDKLGYPIVRVEPNSSGRVAERYAIPTPVRDSIAQIATDVRISATDAAELQRSIREAADAGQPVLRFTGETLSEGAIPLSGAGEAGAGAQPST